MYSSGPGSLAIRKKITPGRLMAYGGGNLLGSGVIAIAGAWLLYFYTTFCGLTLIEASIIFSVASVTDTISNPVMGYLTDHFGNTRLGRRFGRRRFFLLIGAPLMVFYPLLWIEGFGFWYYLFTYVAFELIYTSVMVPYETLASEMTDDFVIRTKLTGYKAIFGNIANFLAAFIPGQFILIYGKESSQPFLYTGICYGVILFIAISALYLATWEDKNSPKAGVPQGGSLWKTGTRLVRDIKSTFHLRVFRKHLGMYLFGYSAEGIFISLFTYYIIFALQFDPSILAGLNSLSSLLQLVSTIIFSTICVRYGFSKPYICALLFVIFAVCSHYLLHFFNLSPIVTVITIISITVIYGLGTGGVYYIPWALYTFLADVDEVFTGRRREGVYAGSMTFAGKISRSIIVFSVGATLTHFGFQPKSHIQPESAVNAISWIFFGGVTVLALIAIFFSCQMTLNRKTHQIVSDEIDRIRQGGKINDAGEEARKTIETLVGWPYEQCWGNNVICKKMQSP
ncbi:MFS transporter [Morganella psychrotolerans]|uniref:MFS transporter n=1 Tax=Morganella psychrotolerans TaxID=368603 RepID=A0A5M9R320_9GAMM|nr:MFS transporter [Morganella psychrotolerans]KAA8714669.1 MFS transporter [Morganella psychrotolerans]